MSKKSDNTPLVLGAVLVTALLLFKSDKKQKPDKGFMSELASNKRKLANIAILLNEMKRRDITNKFAKTAILDIISKESEFIPREENLNYTSEQLQKVFSLSKSEADKLAHNPVLIANRVYGGKGGNAQDEGYKYRGMGFVNSLDEEQILYNQLTFKNSYKRLGEQTGLDLINHPEQLLLPEPAAKVAIQFFLNGITEGHRSGKLKQYNATDINDFKSLNDAVGAIYHINAGWGSSNRKLLADVTGGIKKAFSRAPALLTLVTNVA